MRLVEIPIYYDWRFGGGEVLTSQEIELLDALRQVARVHSGDGDLVRGSARSHGVMVVEGGLFKPVERGNYNPRIPQGVEKEVKALGGVDVLVVGCEDYRQVGEVLESLEITKRQIKNKKTAIFATAGGASQGNNRERFEVDKNFYVAFLRNNPNATLYLTGHTGVCGGENYFSNGIMADGRKQYGEKWEIGVMEQYILRMYNEVRRAIPEAAGRIHMGLAIVGDDDKFREFRRIQP